MNALSRRLQRLERQRRPGRLIVISEPAGTAPEARREFMKSQGIEGGPSGLLVVVLRRFAPELGDGLAVISDTPRA